MKKILSLMLAITLGVTIFGCNKVTTEPITKTQITSLSAESFEDLCNNYKLGQNMYCYDIEYKGKYFAYLCPEMNQNATQDLEQQILKALGDTVKVDTLVGPPAPINANDNYKYYHFVCYVKE